MGRQGLTLWSISVLIRSGAKEQLKASRTSGGNGCHQRRHAAPGTTATARVRQAGEDFDASFSELRRRVREACAPEEDWETRVVAGINAVLAYATANPGAARAITVQARTPDGDGDRQVEVIDYFTEVLSSVAPEEARFPISTNRGIVESIASVVRGHLLAGTCKELPGTAHDLAYLTLMPFLGMRGTTERTSALFPSKAP
jgi:hypothetical protein